MLATCALYCAPLGSTPAKLTSPACARGHKAVNASDNSSVKNPDRISPLSMSLRREGPRPAGDGPGASTWCPAACRRVTALIAVLRRRVPSTTPLRVGDTHGEAVALHVAGAGGLIDADVAAGVGDHRARQRGRVGGRLQVISAVQRARFVVDAIAGPFLL